MKQIYNISFFLLIAAKVFAQDIPMKINYADSAGLKQGYWIDNYINDSNKIKSVKFYLDNMMSGTYYSFYETGQLEAIIEYEKNKKDGTYCLFYKNGAIQSYAEYSKGKRLYYAKYRMNGIKEYEEIVKDGDKIIKHFTKSGIIKGREIPQDSITPK